MTPVDLRNLLVDSRSEDPVSCGSKRRDPITGHGNPDTQTSLDQASTGRATATSGPQRKQTFEGLKHRKRQENRDSAMRMLVKVAIQMRLTKIFELTMTLSTVTEGALLPFRWKSG